MLTQLLLRLGKFYRVYGRKLLILLPLYPCVLLFTTPLRLADALWACRIFLNGQWGYYPHFNPVAGINSLFYWTEALNIHRYGYSGSSPTIGLGNWKLTSWFHVTLFSLYAYWKAGAVSILTGMLIWWLSHLLYIGYTETQWLVLIMVLALISSTFYTNLFGTQNYNVLGWSFFPVGIFAIICDHWLWVAIAWFLVSLGSFTAAITAIALSWLLFIYTYNPWLIIATLPATIKIAFHFYRLVSSKELMITALSNIAKAIGATGRNVKYKRPKLELFSLHQFYWLILYLQFSITAWLVAKDSSVLILIGTFLFILNTKFIRFADPQSIMMANFSIATAIVIMHPNLAILISYWLVISPIPQLAGFPISPNSVSFMPRAKPYNVNPVLEQVYDFISKVPKCERVLFAFSDPGNDYGKIFDGQRVILESILYIANKRAIHLLPDWWAVFQTNYEGAPSFWGREINEVFSNAKEWKANYVIVYTDPEQLLGREWEMAGFVILARLDWREIEGANAIHYPNGGPPTWWLLKVPSSVEAALI